MKMWFNQHKQALQLVLSRLQLQHLNTLMIVAVIGITVSLPSLIYIMVDNLSSVVQQVKQNAQITVFLDSEIDPVNTEHLVAVLYKLDTVSKVKFVSKDEALAQMVKQYPDQNLTENLGMNPLPDAFYLSLTDQSPENIASLKTHIEGMKWVKEVLVDSDWLKRLNHIINLGRNVALLLGLLLSVAMIAVISNTVRMQMLTHQVEIEVSRLIGATYSFIRRPFLYLGVIYGLCGGAMAMLILGLVLIPLNLSIQSIAQDYHTNFSMSVEVFKLGFSVMSTSAIIGWLAAWVAIRQQN